MLKKFKNKFFILKFTLIVFLITTFKTSANYLPIKVNCNEKKCCARIDSIEFKIDQLLSEIKKGKMSQEEVACSYHQIANEYYSTDQVKSIEFNKKAETIRLKNKDSLLWITYLNLAFNYYNIDDNNTAKTYMELALFTEANKQPYDYLTIYQSLGEYNSGLGDYETAELYINQALATKVEEKEKITAYNIKSRILIESKDSLKIRESINFADTALILCKLYDDDLNNRTYALNNIANAHEFLGNYDESIFFYKKATKKDKDNIFRIAQFLHNIAAVQRDQYKYDESNSTAKKALNLFKENLNTKNSYWYSGSYENLADNHTFLLQFDTALMFYQKALINLTNNFRTEDILQNPNPKDTALFIYSNLDMIRVLHLKSTTAYKHYQQNKEEKYLNLANQCYNTAFDFHDKLQKNISTENSRLFQVKNIVPYIENALKVAYELQEKDQDVGETAFRFMEKNKTTVLLQSMNETDALKYANLPDSLLEQEKDLKIAITFHQRQFNEAIEYEDTLEMERLDKLLFDEKEQYRELINNLENNHPEYYRLKYQQNQIQLTDVQNQLNDKTALLSYFVGDSSIYTLLILGDSTQLFKAQKPSNWEIVINKFRETITLSNPEEKFNKYSKKSFKKFINNAQFLYQHLLKKPLAGLNHIPNLKIIPDAELNYIPFELLFADINDTTSVNYKNLPYLLKQKTISYAYSAALMMEQKQAKASTTEKNYEYGGYTPIYSDTIYSDLPKARQLVNNMASFFKGKQYLNEQATKASFLKDTLSYQILHLAMHGKLKNQYPLNSHLVFTKSKNDTVEDSYQLYASDLYLHQLDTDLTILNACETGTGKLHKGEGVMSLSRAFTYAGCPSLMMSLWSIDEQPSAEILETFLKSIKKGNLKDVALRQAKLDYLNNTKTNLSHPYYWAGLVLTGNTEAMEFKYSLSEFWWVLGLFLILAGGYWASKIPSNKISHSKEISQ